MSSVQSRTIPAAVVRARLCRARNELRELEGYCAPGLNGDLSTVLDVIEQVLMGRFGWQYPEELTGRDRDFLAIVGAL